ncbi:hypothetical protein KC865_03970 [Candidatus Kaiserbacteria bacterium]|nr:hypothetical protein [Candidatus Kaiserbacteria bacterium]
MKDVHFVVLTIIPSTVIMTAVFLASWGIYPVMFWEIAGWGILSMVVIFTWWAFRNLLKGTSMSEPQK